MKRKAEKRRKDARRAKKRRERAQREKRRAEEETAIAASPTLAFERVYRQHKWGDGFKHPLSGRGSAVAFNEGYIGLVEKFITSNQIRSVVDIGCGDWTFSRLIDWSRLNVRYTGIDVYAPLIVQHQRQYAQPGRVSFMVGDVTNPNFCLPAADLYIMKDVMQHWPDAAVRDTLKRFAESKLNVLVTNTSQSKRTANDKFGAAFRALSHTSALFAPFSPVVIMTWGSAVDPKETVLFPFGGLVPSNIVPPPLLADTRIEHKRQVFPQEVAEVAPQDVPPEYQEEFFDEDAAARAAEEEVQYEQQESEEVQYEQQEGEEVQYEQQEGEEVYDDDHSHGDESTEWND